MVSIADRFPFSFRLDIIPDPGDGASFPNHDSFYCAMELTADGEGPASPHVEYIDMPTPAFAGLFVALELLGPSRSYASRVVRFQTPFTGILSTFAVFGFRTGVGLFISVAENGIYRWVALDSSNGSDSPNFYAMASSQAEVDNVTHRYYFTTFSVNSHFIGNHTS